MRGKRPETARWRQLCRAGESSHQARAARSDELARRVRPFACLVHANGVLPEQTQAGRIADCPVVEISCLCIHLPSCDLPRVVHKCGQDARLVPCAFHRPSRERDGSRAASPVVASCPSRLRKRDRVNRSEPSPHVQPAARSAAQDFALKSDESGPPLVMKTNRIR